MPHAGGVGRRGRVLLFALLGYAYLAVVVALLIGAIIVLFIADVPQLLWLPGGLLILVVVVLVQRLTAPEGCRVTSAEVPRLFAVIEEARSAAHAPRCDQVLLSGDVNAGVLDVPRFGVFGSRRLLYIGLPLLHALPLDEVRAVLAHEFAHLAHRHGRRRARAARLSAMWSSLAVSVQWGRNWGAFLFVPFFRWYAPRLQAVVERESRVDEHEADGVAAHCAGTGPAGRSLLRIGLAEAFAQRAFWPALRAESAERETPPDDAIVRLAASLDGCLAHEQAAAWIGMLLRERAVEDDSHPSLADRLAALGVPATPERAADVLAILRHARGVRAADALLERDAAHRYAVALSEQWAVATRNEWRGWHADAQLIRHAGGSLGEEAAALRARARWAAFCQPPESAIPVLEDVVQRLPDATEARFLLGQLLLLQGTDAERDGVGTRLLEQVMAEESDLAHGAATVLRRHYARHAASRHVRRCLERERQLEAATLKVLRERSVLRPRDTLRPHPLPAAALATIRAQLRSVPEIRRAYLVQKRTKHLRASPVTVLALEFATPWHRQPAFRSLYEEVYAALAERVSVPDAASVTLVPVGRRGRLRERLRSMAGAEIYDSADDFPEVLVAAGEWTRAPLGFALLKHPVVAIGGSVLVVSVLLGAGVAWLSSALSARDDLAARQQAVRDDPADAQAQLELAWALIDVGRLEDALAPARAAVRLAPDNADAHNSLGWLLLQRRDLAPALQHLQTAIRLAPDHPWAHSNLGWTLYALRRYEDAEASFLEALRIAPDEPDTRIGLAAVLEDQRRVEEAEAELHEAIRRAPNFPGYRGALGAMLARRGRVDDALDVYRAALVVFPEDARFWREIGVLEHALGRHGKAIEAFRALERLAPEVFLHDDVARKMFEASLAGRQYQG